MSRMLTPSERKAKKEKKLLGAAQEGEAALVSVFCIRDLSSPQNKFKVRVNAEVENLALMLPALWPYSLACMWHPSIAKHRWE